MQSESSSIDQKNYMQKTTDLSHFTFIDLTHSLSPTIPQWGENCGFQHKTECDYTDCDTDVKFRVQKFEMSAGIGTHMDAPAHCIPGGLTIADIPLEKLITPCVVIDISEKANERYSLSRKDIIDFENKYGIIPANTFVIIYTGWGKLWNQPIKYRNNLVFPSVSKEAAELFIERNITGLGIDTLSPDRAEDGFPVHQLLLNSGKYIIENVANCNNLPCVGAFIIALPIKIKDATEAPIRLVGMIPTLSMAR